MKKLISLLLIASLMISVIPMMIVPVSADAWSDAGYDCVAYARARFQEIHHFALHNTGGGNAQGYYYNAGSFGDTVSSTPAVGALAVWGTGNVGFSHVAIVEAVDGSNVTISEGGYSNQGEASHANRRTFYGDMTIRWANGTKYQNFLGFVYVAGTNPPSPPLPKGHEMSESEAAGRTISDGDYWICNRISYYYFLDVPGTTYNTSNETTLQMWIMDSEPYLASAYDVFHVKYLNNGFYEISQYNTKMSLDVYSASLDCGTNVQMYDSNNTKAQQWSIEQTGSGYRIRSRCNSFCLDVAAGAYSNGTNVRVWESNDSDAQRFGFIPYAPNERPFADGVYTIVSAIADTCFLDVSGVPGGFTAGSNVQVYNSNDIWGHPDEKFRFEYAGNGYYRIYEATSGLPLEIYNPGSSEYLSAEKTAKLYTKNSSRGQLWRIRENTDGTYSFINQLAGYCLDVRSGKSENGTNAQDFPDNGTKAQKWKPLRVLQDDMVTVENVVISGDEAIEPTVTVKVDNTVLSAGTDYTVTVSADIANLKGTVTVKGKNNYCNTITKEFTITLKEILGDADGDGEISAIDVAQIMRYVAHIDTGVDEEVLMNADVDGNGELEIVDATYIQRYLTRMETPYAIGEAI